MNGGTGVYICDSSGGKRSTQLKFPLLYKRFELLEEMSFGPLDLDSIDRAGQPLEGLSQHSPGEKIKIRLKFSYYILSIIKVNLAKCGNYANLHYEEYNGC